MAVISTTDSTHQPSTMTHQTTLLDMIKTTISEIQSDEEGAVLTETLAQAEAAKDASTTADSASDEEEDFEYDFSELEAEEAKYAVKSNISIVVTVSSVDADMDSQNHNQCHSPSVRISTRDPSERISCLSVGSMWSTQSGEDCIRPSLYREEVKELARLSPFPVKVNDSEVLDLSVEVPSLTLKSQVDPTVFYRLPVGFGLWDAACCLTAQIADSEGDLTKFLDESLVREAELDMDKDLGHLRSLHGKSVHELGCGVAPLPALTCAALGAEKAVATDYLPEILDIAERNMKTNQEKYPNQLGKNLHAGYLKWGDRSLDPQVDDQFDVLLGADIMYTTPDILDQLADSLTNHLSKKNSLLLLSRTIRMGEREDHWVTNTLIKKHGWKLVGKKEENVQARWEKYGRMAHNARPGMQDKMEVIALVR